MCGITTRRVLTDGEVPIGEEEIQAEMRLGKISMFGAGYYVAIQ